jgi:hypothetical protein
MRENSKGLEGDTHYALKIFTDNIVLGYPLQRPHFDHGEPELGDIFGTFAEFQAGLAMEGFFIRGGIAFGEHYMDDDIVFGKALLEAVEQDKGGGPPRITIAPSALEKLDRQLAFYGEPERAPHNEYLLKDSDGGIFLNYLSEAFYAFPEGGILLDMIEGHQNALIEGLKTYKSNPGVRAKFEWAARYHNFVCNDYAERYEDAKGLTDYLVEIESYAAKPSHLQFVEVEG